MNIFNRVEKRFENNDKLPILPNVDHVYCITMPERRNYAMKTLNIFNINITFFDAIKPSDLTKGEYTSLSDTYNPYNKRMFRKMTKLPVHLSYTMCFLDALKKGYKTIIIFEDDIIVNVKKLEMNKSIQEFLSTDFIMFYMGYCWANCKQDYDKTEYTYLVEVPNKTLYCNHAIVFKMEYIEELIDFMYPMTSYSDDMFVDFFIDNNYSICVPKDKPYFNQNRDNFISLNENYNTNLPFCDLSKTCKN